MSSDSPAGLPYLRSPVSAPYAPRDDRGLLLPPADDYDGPDAVPDHYIDDRHDHGHQHVNYHVHINHHDNNPLDR